MTQPLRVLLVGAGGRMGKAILAAAEDDAAFTIAATARRGDDFASGAKDCDVVIDFSLASATEDVCAACVAEHRPLVLGTTGHTPAQREIVQQAATKIPIVFTANFSLGVNVLCALVRQAAKSLGEKFEVEIVEAHHRTKKDSPSGTARRLAEVLQETGHAEVPVHAIRAGDIVGDHEVIFAGAGERLELIHRASSRATFAQGALQAAKWVLGKPPALYRMEDVLGL